MRVDVLSMLLSLANVGPYSDALVLDKLGSLVVGTAAERIRGDTSLVFSFSTRCKNNNFAFRN
jgi:Gcd10p family